MSLADLKFQIVLIIWTGYRDRKALWARKLRGFIRGLASGVYYVGCHVFGGELGGYGYLGDDMLHLKSLKVHKSERKACAPCIRTGTDMGYECLFDERGDNSTFANTLW